MRSQILSYEIDESPCNHWPKSRIQVWKGCFFKETFLISSGLTISHFTLVWIAWKIEDKKFYFVYQKLRYMAFFLETWIIFKGYVPCSEEFSKKWKEGICLPTFSWRAFVMTIAKFSNVIASIAPPKRNQRSNRITWISAIKYPLLFATKATFTRYLKWQSPRRRNFEQSQIYAKVYVLSRKSLVNIYFMGFATVIVGWTNDMIWANQLLVVTAPDEDFKTTIDLTKALTTSSGG